MLALRTKKRALIVELPEGIKPLTDLTRTRVPSTATRIFDKKKADLISDLLSSIEQAKGRYVENKRASPLNPVELTDDGEIAKDKDGNTIVLNKVAAAPNWRVQMNAKTKSNPNPSVVLVDDAQKGEKYPDEAVFVYLKAGRTKVPMWPAQMTDGEYRLTEKRFSSADLVEILEYLKSQVEGWTPESKDGRIFHQVGVIDAIAPRVRTRMAEGKAHAHCAEEDRIVEIGEVKRQSQLSLSTPIQKMMEITDVGLLKPLPQERK